MNNENNDGFLPGVGNSENNNNPIANTPQNIDQNISNSTPINASMDINQNFNMDPNQFDPNMNNNFVPNQFDPNMNNGFEQNQFDPNIGQVPFDMNQPNMGQAPFGMNQPNVGQAPFDMNQPNMNPAMNNNLVQNQFEPNMNNGFEPNMNNNFVPNQFDSNNGFEQNQFDNMGQAPFDVNQPNMNNNLGQNQFESNMNNGFEPNMNSNFVPNQFDSNNGFEQNQFDNMGQAPFDVNQPNMNNNFSDDESSNYATDFERNWMGAIYDKAYSRKFNFCAAFFGPAYLFYRKIYLTGGLTTLILIIVSIIISMLKLTNIGLLLGIYAIIMLIYFLGLGFGFYPIYKDYVHKQFNKYKQQIVDNNQLVALASKKGGTSVLSLIIYYIAMSVISTIMVSVMFASLMAGLFNKLPQTNNTTNTDNSLNNIIEESTSSFVFTAGDDTFEFEYPNTWIYSDDNNIKSLTKGAHNLTYTVAYKPSDLGVTDMSSADGRSAILKIINTSVTNLATTNNLQMESNDNFVSQNGSYYTYINLSSDTEVTRYYFVLIPSEERLFQFELKLDNTVVDYDTHLEVIEMLTNIIASDDTAEIDGNSVQNNTITNNTVDDNSVVTSNTTNNTTSNDISNNGVSEENTTVQNNTTQGNTTAQNNTTSGVSNVLRNITL